MPSPADYRVYNRYGFALGDLFVAAENGQPCTLSQVTRSRAARHSDNIVHGRGIFTRTAPRAGGLQPARRPPGA